MAEYYVDRMALHKNPTGILLRAKDRTTGKWASVDIAHIETESLLRWIREKEGKFPGYTERLVFLLVGKEHPGTVSGPDYAEPEPMLKECPACEGRGVAPGDPSDPTYNDATGDSDCRVCQGSGTIEKE